MIVSPLRMAKQKAKAVNFGRKSVVVTDSAGNAVNISPSISNASGGVINIMVLGEISEWWGVNQRDVYWALKANPSASQINVFISSPGGEVDTAFVIHDMLKGHKANCTAYLMGQCASSATIIACAADQTVMSDQCLYMIHKPSWVCWGDADQMRKGADILDKYQALIINVYKKKTKMDEATLNELMNQETWFEPSEALSMGFVDDVVDTIEVVYETTYAPEQSSGNEDYYLYDSAAEYRVAAYHALEKGMKPFQGKSKPSPKSNTTMFGKNFFTNLLKNLQTFGAVDKNADIEKLAGDLADDQTLVKDLDTAAIQAAAEAAVAKMTMTLTPKQIIDALSKATDEEKSQLATALGGPNTDEDDEEEDSVSNQIKNLEEEIVRLKKGGASGQAAGNGKSATEKEKKESGKGTLNKAQKDLLVKSYKDGTLSAEMYTKLTGEAPPARN